MSPSYSDTYDGEIANGGITIVQDASYLFRQIEFLVDIVAFQKLSFDFIIFFIYYVWFRLKLWPCFDILQLYKIRAEIFLKTIQIHFIREHCKNTLIFKHKMWKYNLILSLLFYGFHLINRKVFSSHFPNFSQTWSYQNPMFIKMNLMLFTMIKTWMLSNRDMLELIGNMKVFLEQSGGSERDMNEAWAWTEHDLRLKFGNRGCDLAYNLHGNLNWRLYAKKSTASIAKFLS